MRVKCYVIRTLMLKHSEFNPVGVSFASYPFGVVRVPVLGSFPLYLADLPFGICHNTVLIELLLPLASLTGIVWEPAVCMCIICSCVRVSICLLPQLVLICLHARNLAIWQKRPRDFKLTIHSLKTFNCRTPAWPQ